jgi:glycosyltransferase involved in cell wall biosynthesis
MTPPRLRVAVVARAVMPLHGVGGLERSVRDLVRYLAARDVEVTLITPPPKAVITRSPDDPFGSHRIHLRHVPYLTFPMANRRGTTILDRSTAYPVFGWRAGRLAADLVGEGVIDVVHGFGASVLGYALARRRARQAPDGPAGRAASAPLVFNPQGLEEFGATGSSQPWAKRLGYLPLRRAVRRCAEGADRILATDVSLDPMDTRHLHPAPDQLRTSPNGIDLAEVTAAAAPADGLLIRQRHRLAPGALVLLSVARLEQNKGLDVLADALARAGRADQPLAAIGWRWVIVGSGPERRTIEAAVEAHGIGRHVLFAGRVSEADLHAWYEAASLFVHPTRYEGSSIVTLEAMAHRRAIVATVAGGLPDKVRPGQNGWLVPPGDAGALADALTAAASEPMRLRAMGRHSRTLVEREFAWDVLIDRQIAMYDELLGRSRAAPVT